MDLRELEERTSIERRKLRYVLDHELVPQLHIQIVDDEAGRPRHFAADVGFGIVCAAKLLELGLPHESIRRFLAGLLEIRCPGSGRDPVLALVHMVLAQRCQAFADLGDSEWVRLRVSQSASGFSWKSDWQRWSGLFVEKIPFAELAPITIVTLDLGQIRDLVFH